MNPPLPTLDGRPATTAALAPWPVTPRPRGRIIVAGEALVDDLPPAEPGGPRRVVPGGAPVNVAVAAARLGAPMAFAGPIGDDEAGRMIAGHLDRAGAGLLIGPAPRPTARALVSLDETGHPSYEFEVDGTACRMVEVLPSRVRGARAVVVVGGAIGFDDQPLGASLSLLPGAVNSPLWLDPNVRPNVLGPDETSRNRYRRLVEALVSEATLVKCSDEDLRLLYGDDGDPLDVAIRWARSGPALVVLTRGAKGLSAVRASGRTVDVEPPPIDPGLLAGGDTVGAGDTVTGALLAWCHRRGRLGASDLTALGRDDLEDALTFAASAAAVTVSRPGADPPTLDDLPSA